MKCPKCGYLGFEDVDRCRNCGYDFSLVVPPALPELTIRRAEDDDIAGEIDDLALIDPAAESATAPQLQLADDDEAAAPEAAAPARPTARRNAASSADALPLFGGGDDDAPLITRPSPPRPPLAVRRATPEVPRTRSETPRAPLLELSGAALGSRPGTASHDDRGWPYGENSDGAPAGVGARVIAAAIDLLILAAIDFVVVYFTMQICGLTMADLHILPKGPLLAFLLVQNGGYLVAFTAGGQTLGKMATGIRVVSTSTSGPVDVAHSVLRTVIWLLLAVPAGLGFVSTLFGPEHRGLHDRFAGTRVIKGLG